MTRHKLYHISPNYARETLNSAVTISDELAIKEKELISLLARIDKDRLFLRYGFRSLRPFCVKALRMSRIQAQRIVTESRRLQTTFDSEHKNTTQN